MTTAPSTRTRLAPDRPRIHLGMDTVVGGTPLVRLARVVPSGACEILVKLEFLNPAGSVKDRIGRSMIEAAESEGRLAKGGHIIEPTSGNTGIALAFICAAKGYKLTLCMPESMSIERRAMLRHLGAHLVLTPAELGMSGAVNRARELYESESRHGPTVMPQQFDNPANPAVHQSTTGPEIWEAVDGRIDAFVAGVGTGGTITGVTRHIRPLNPEFRAIAVEPSDSPVISGGKPGPHKIQGIGAGFVPANLDVSLLDEVITVTNEQAVDWARRLASEEGLLGGISTGANVCAAVQAATRPEFKGKRIVTVACSFAERYQSTVLFSAAS